MGGAHQYLATVIWQRAADAAFADNRYSREHQWHFDGGTVVTASSSPAIVPVPLSNPAGVDPEEAFVASLSSCHMLFFLFHASKKGYGVDRYEDQASGVMGKNARGAMAMTHVTLRPRVSWSGERVPTAEQVHALHEQSHKDCFIANSVTTEVKIDAVPTICVPVGDGSMR